MGSVPISSGTNRTPFFDTVFDIAGEIKINYLRLSADLAIE